MKTAKLGALFMVSLMAIAGVGASYAVWSDQVAINATATTGNLEWRITDFAVRDQTTIGGANPVIWTGVGNWGESESITVTVQPTYPGWAAICVLYVKNTGNLPLTMYSVQITYAGGDAALMNWYSYGIPVLDPATLPGITFQGPGEQYLSYWTTEYAFTGTPYAIPVGQTIGVQAYFKLSPDVPQAELDPLTVTLTLKATTAAITY
ncbi:MAG: hypothetical protein NTX92_09470 [Euryarchaeota archaeon]|nr:hypothetical protein [Euryarchaeota archaeon]